MPTVNRIFNFAAGPAVLPLPVLEEIQRDLVSLPGVGMSILEISHRSETFEAVLAKAEADIRTLGNIPSNYKVLFLQGGASTQFSMVRCTAPVSTRRGPKPTFVHWRAFQRIIACCSCRAARARSSRWCR